MQPSVTTFNREAAMAKKNHHEGGTIDSTDLATILRERQKSNEAYPRVWTHNRPRTWAEAVRSIFRIEPPIHSKHH
jgi:hypothetical protein